MIFLSFLLELSFVSKLDIIFRYKPYTNHYDYTYRNMAIQGGVKMITGISHDIPSGVLKLLLQGS